MYETYVPIPETIEERRPPTIAEIVRQKTDDGARIIDFFLDVMEGRVAGAQLCHMIDAAKQLVKYGSKKAADFLAEHGDETCDHCESRKRGPRPRKDEGPVVGPLHVQGPFPYDFLSLLTEDFLTVLSAVDEDLMIMLVRAQTRDGGTVVDFLDEVMHGRDDDFRANHRIAAARELISHILRDEHRSHIPFDNVGADPRVRPLPGASAQRNPEPNLIVVPAKAGTQRGGEGRSEISDEPDVSPAERPERNTVVVPAEAGTQRGGEGRPKPTEEPVEATPVVVPAKAGTQRGGVGRSEPTEEPAVSPAEGPERNTIVVPAKAGTQRGGEGRSELSEEPTPTTAEAPQPETRPRRRTRTQRRRAGNARAAMRREASTIPGRSPPS